LATVASWESFGGKFLARLGTSVAGRGDVFADGFGDVLLGARGYADGVVTGGAAFLHAGNGGSGPPRPLRQLRTDGVTPVALLGASDSQSQFRWEAWGRSAAGRTRVRPVWEVRELGAAFDPSGASVGSWLGTGAPQAGVGSRVLLHEFVSGLGVSRFYRWRVRVRSSSPYFPGSPWSSLPGNGPTETDLRTSPPPVAAPVVAESLARELHARPSPFRASVEISFVAPRREPARVTVHDVAGRRVRTLLDRFVDGPTTLRWDGRDESDREVAPGVYFVRWETDDRVAVTRVVRVR
jgi:hypothetical protein